MFRSSIFSPSPNSMSRHNPTKQFYSAADVIAGTYSLVFIDTSLDTHLATIVSHSDTVSDLKAKILLEHLRCFPKIGEIKIHALKVKRKGNFYHLSESMLVSSAFKASKKDWFISVDASCLANPLALVRFQSNSSGEPSLKKMGCTNPKPLDTYDSAPNEFQDVKDEGKDTETNQRDENSQFMEYMRASNKADDVAALAHILEDQVALTNSAIAAAREACNDIEMENKDVYNKVLDSGPAAQRKKRKLESTESSENPLDYKRRKHGNEDRSFNENVEHGDSSKKKPVQEMDEMTKVTPPLVGSDMRENDAVNPKGNIDVAAGINGSSKRTKTIKHVKNSKISNQDLCGIDQAKSFAGESQLGVDDHVGPESKSKQVSEQKAADGSSSGAVIEDTIIQHLPQAKAVPIESVKVGETKKEKKVRESAARISQSATNLDFNGNLVKKSDSFMSRIEDVVEASLQQNPVDTSDKELSSTNGHPEMDSLPLTQPNSKSDVDIGEKFGTDIRESDAVNPKGNADVAAGIGSNKSKTKKKVKKVQVSNQDQANDSAGEIASPVDDHLNVESKSKQVSEQKQVDGSSSGAVKENEDLPQGNPDDNIENKEALAISAKPVEVVSSKVGETKKKKRRRSAAKLADGVSQTANDSVVNGDSVNVVKKDDSLFSPSDADLQQNPVDTSMVASDKEFSSMNQPNRKTNVAVDGKSRKKRNEDEKIQDAVDVVGKSKRKPIKKQKFQTKSRSNLPLNEVHAHKSAVLDDKQKKEVEMGKNEAENEIDFKNYFVSEKKDKKVVSEVKKNRPKQEKSLLVTPPAIFSDDSSSDSSGEGKKIVNRATTIHTPSSSSGSSMESVKNERKGGGKNSKILPKSTAPKGLTLDMIMRSSSLFKKAKLTALQDSESQAVEFVPDSQPNL